MRQKVVFLQNFKQRLEIFGWNLRTLQFLAFLADLPTSERKTAGESLTGLFIAICEQLKLVNCN